MADTTVISGNTSRIGNASSARQARLAGIVMVAALIAYAWLQWGILRPDAIEGWRETDTQTIARNFTESPNIFYPRIDWGGAGEGYVETEFQLYTWITSLIMRMADPLAEWPAQLLSLLAVMGAGWVAFSRLSTIHGQLAAAAGAAALLTTKAVMQAATTVQPESLCLLLFVVAWFALRDFARSGNLRSLLLYALTGAAAMLVKPTAGQLGIASFLLVLIQSPALLKRKEIWIAWACMVGALVLHMLHARGLYLEYGNTFGVLSGGESKVPRLGLLFSPELILRAASHSVSWGVGLVGAAAFGMLLALRFRSWRELAPVGALLAGVVVWTLLALRYTTSDGGNHYHVLGAVFAAEAVAGLVVAVRSTRWHAWAGAALAVVLALQFTQSYQTRKLTRSNPFDAGVVAVSESARAFVRPGDLVIVRSVHPAYDEFWQDVIQFADPRVFYLTRTRGWPVAKDMDDPVQFDQAVKAGARFYIEPEARGALPRLDAWLDQNATLLATSSLQGRVYALQPR